MPSTASIKFHNHDSLPRPEPQNRTRDRHGLARAAGKYVTNVRKTVFWLVRRKILRPHGQVIMAIVHARGDQSIKSGTQVTEQTSLAFVDNHTARRMTRKYDSHAVAYVALGNETFNRARDVNDVELTFRVKLERIMREGR